METDSVIQLAALGGAVGTTLVLLARERIALLAGIARLGIADMNQLVLWLVSFYLVLVVAEARELASDARRRSPEA